MHRYALRTAAARWSRGRVARVLHSTQHTHTLAHSWRGKSTGFTLRHCVSVSLGVEVVVEPGRLEGVAGRRAARRDEGDADAGRSDAARPREGSSTATEEPSGAERRPSRAKPRFESSRRRRGPRPTALLPRLPDAAQHRTAPAPFARLGLARLRSAQLASERRKAGNGLGSARSASRHLRRSRLRPLRQGPDRPPLQHLTLPLPPPPRRGAASWRGGAGQAGPSFIAFYFSILVVVTVVCSAGRARTAHNKH